MPAKISRFLDPAVETLFPPYNTRVGSQGFRSRVAPPHQGTIIEQEARVAWELGSDIFKFSLTRNQYEDMTVPASANTVVELIEQTPPFQRVLDTDFTYTCMWVHPVSVTPIDFHDGLSRDAAKIEYDQLYELTRFLLQRYQGTGRSFLLGHWEGDWTLLNGIDPSQTPTPLAIQGMIDWYKTRQKAVEAARASLPACKDVHVYHYVEVNLVQKSIDHPNDPKFYTVANGVLPHVTVDLVSYSAYDALSGNYLQLPQRAFDHLDFIESHAQFSGAWPFKRSVFIGEFGYGMENDDAEQNRRNTLGLRAAIRWGCPLIYYWAIYGAPGAENLRLVNPDGTFTLEHRTLQHLLAGTVAQRDIWRLFLDRNPDESEQTHLMDEFETTSATTLLAAAYDSPEFTSMSDNRAFLQLLFRQVLRTTDYASPLFGTLLAILDGKTRNRWQTMLDLLDSDEFSSAVSDQDFALYLYQKTLARTPDRIVQAEVAAVAGRLAAGEKRSVLWQEFLDTVEFRNAGLETRSESLISETTLHRLTVNVGPVPVP